MNPKPKPSWKSPWLWCGYALPTLIALTLLISPLGGPLASLSFDLLYLFRPPVDPAALTNVVVLIMDEQSRVALVQDANPPWDRAVHARLIRELKARGAKVVAFDVLFDEPSPNAQADEQLADAIREHGNVVLAAVVQSSKEAPLSSIVRPIEMLSSNATWGVVEIPGENTSILRQQLNYVHYKTFAWQAAMAFGQAPPERLVARWLNYYGPDGTLPTVSYHRALAHGALPPDFFASKAVFVGRGSLITSQGQSSDRYATPFSRWQPGQTSGVEIQATAFLNLVNGDWFEEVSPLMEVLLLLASGALFGLGLQHLRPWTAAAVAAAAAVVISLGTIRLAWGHHLWFPWLIVCAVQIPCAFGWSVLTYTKRVTQEKENLERSLALAESARASQAQNEAPGSGAPGDKALALSASQNTTLEVLVPPIPNHRLLRRIGRGSYGEVWLARDEIGTYHAVKIVYQRSFSSSTPYDREFRGIQRFTPISRSHPGFVHILHVGRNDPEGYFFYIMEVGDDEHTGQQIDPATYSPFSLAKKLEAGRLPLAECVQLGLALTAALKHLHQHQLVHRDIKPSNIIFVHRAPKFADVGLVTDLAAPGKDVSLVGTEGYIAPEGPGTAAADIYSLGKVLYEVCTGRDRQDFPSVSSTLIASGDEKFGQLNEIILKACQAEPSQRYQSSSQMHDDLLRIKL